MKKFDIDHNLIVYIEQLYFLHQQLLFTIGYIIENHANVEQLPYYENEFINNFCELELVKRAIILKCCGKYTEYYRFNFSDDALEIINEI